MKTGQIYYPTGELYFIGRYDENTIREDGIPYRLYAGVQFYRNGNVHMEGIFQWGGLFYGRLFYPSGKLKFIGQFNEKHGEITGAQPEDYYGPTYPLEGIYYLREWRDSVSRQVYDLQKRERRMASCCRAGRVRSFCIKTNRIALAMQFKYSY